MDSLNIKKRCGAVGVGFWQCPHFLFPVTGLIIIISIIVTYLVASRVTEPEIAALIVLAVTAFLFIVGHTIVRSFENIVEASRLKSEFVSIISHELRSPLSAVKWSLDLLKSDNTRMKASDSAESVISSIGEQNEKMIRIVNGLLEVERIEEKKMSLAPEKIFLKELTEKIIGDLSLVARDLNVKADLETKTDAPVFADPQKISFVIFSILENALRYSPAGSSVKIEIYEKSGSIFWSAANTGAGIPKEDRQKIFEKFFRSRDVYRYRSGGLGIGLFLSKAFVEASGGKIGFLSEENKGSVFWFSLPRV